MRKPVEILVAWPMVPLSISLFIGFVVSLGYFFYDDFYFLHWVRHAKPSPPPAKVVEIKGLENSLSHLPPYSFVYLYSLAVEHDPPERW
ncbi:hypothetical protein GF373_07485 [bacterium]|nr:hypothetical protein [bacterium]